ncbi:MULTISPECIES: hypothetical protein [Pontibacillus]|uniref:Transporter n=1 Tax=Pontibacillus chungwhensis TaxID=265426 RepID=A0ABY8V0W8_9BACI|nr:MULTISPECIES: hypothetical protein [Pontibacillus]MCD5324918.1 hypothetical protein [Pontibacillus sp. HN14]WIF98877.1 hypothetical protein QNI29_04265 [Pontibacillus chungwhensis]
MDYRQNGLNWLVGQLLPGQGGYGGGFGGGFPQQQPFGPTPGQGGGQPPFGPPPGQGGGQPPFGPPPGQGGGGQPPIGPPPAQGQFDGYGGQPSVFAVDPGAFYRCLYRYTRVRLNNGRRFWYYPTFIGRTSVGGYRWRQSQQRWVYYVIDTDRISSFSCS